MESNLIKKNNSLDENNKIFIWDNYNIRTCTYNDKIYFSGKDVATVLGYKRPNDAIIQHVDEHHKIRVKDIGCHQPLFTQPDSVLISKKGVMKIINKTRNIVPDGFIEYLKQYDIFITLERKYVCKEASSMGILSKCLKSLKPEFQKVVGMYRVDMYIPFHRIVVECDEHDHKDRDPKYETKRHLFLVKKFGKDNVIRYNPDSPSFDIYNVVDNIFGTIMSSMGY